MPTPKPLALAATSAASLPDVPLVAIAVPQGGLAVVLQQPQLAFYAEPLACAAAEERFVGEPGQSLLLRVAAAANSARRGASPLRLMLLGLGAATSPTAADWLRFAGRASRRGQELGAGHMAVLATGSAAENLSAIAQGLVLGLYRYTAYKGRPRAAAGRAKATSPAALALTRVTVCLPGAALGPKAAETQLRLGAAIGRGVAYARDWVNCPANALYPQSFVAMAKKLIRGTGLRCRVLGPQQMARAGMGMLLGVGQGSVRPPRLLCISHRGPGRSSAPATALVGKGVTFDSGGLCIKTCDGMGTMKMDMGGAAAVLATLWVVAELKLAGEVHGYMALAENMPAGNALRPGDVLVSAAGITVEVNNTDAEGRLVLGDALHLAQTTRPQRIIDVATLTGACMVALGPKTIGLFSNDDALAQDLGAAALAAGEDIWRLPLTPSLNEQLKSDVADLRNTGDRYGGAITAALFLQKFVGATPWAHLDIAGPAWSSDDAGPSRRGGTGAAVATLVQLLLANSEKAGRRRGPG